MNIKKIAVISLIFSILVLITACITAVIVLKFSNTSDTATPTTDEVETTPGESEIESEEETEYIYPPEPETEEETEFKTPDINIIPGEINFCIQVNIQTNCVTIFARDENGSFSIPYKVMACSAGLPTEEYPNPTPLGSFKLKTEHIWCRMVDWTYSQYSYFIHSDIMFHSVPMALDYNITAGVFPNPVYSVYSPNYVQYTKSRVEVDEFNKLGELASLGCIRLTVADSKWIYDNCPTGTPTVIISADSSADPIPKPEIIKINTDAIPEDCGSFIEVRFPLNEDPYSGKYTTKQLWVAWDPTDPDPANPWNKYGPEITVPEDKVLRVPAGVKSTDFFQHCGVSAIDTCRNDVTDTIKVSDISIFRKKGTYENITLTVKDLLGRTTTETVTFIVY